MFYSYFPFVPASACQLLVSDQKPWVPVDDIMEYLSNYQLPSSLGV